MSGYLFMVVLTFLWNWRRKSDYLQIHYEWKRILAWSVFYFAYTLLLQLKRGFSLAGEGAVSLLALMPLPFVIYAMLNTWERQNLIGFFRQFQAKLARWYFIDWDRIADCFVKCFRVQYCYRYSLCITS